MRIEIVNWEKYNPRNDVKHTTWFRVQNTFWVSLFAFDNDQKMVWMMLLALASTKMTGSYDLDYGLVMVSLCLSKDKLMITLKQFQKSGMIKIPTLRGRYARVTLQTDRQTDRQTDEDSRVLSAPVFRFEEGDFASASWFRDGIKARNPHARNVNRAKMEAWAHEIRMIRESGFTDGEIRGVMQWVLDSNWWRPNIQSTAKLREKWDTLTAAMIAEKRLADKRTPHAGGFRGTE